SGQSNEALAEARRIQKEHPGVAFGYALEGEIHAINQKWPDAVTALRTGLSKQPLSPLAVSTYIAMQSAGKEAEAASFADSWMRQHPSDTLMQQALAEQRMRKEDNAGAIARYRAILDVNPDNPIALNNLAYLLAEKGDPKAREYAERAYQLAPFQPNVVDTLGWTLVRTGDVARGTQLLRLASNLAPNPKEILRHLGRAIIKSADKEGGRRGLDPLPKLDAASP